MLTVSTSIDSATGGVKISWSAPYNNGDTINTYLIEISDALTVSWIPQTTYCDGSITTIKSNMYCVIPMNILTSAPYGLVFD